jgi:hypothetical protein
MNSIIRRFDRAPLEDRLLRANPAQPPKSKQAPGQAARAPHTPGAVPPAGNPAARTAATNNNDRDRRAGKKHKRGGRENQGPQSAFAEELAKAL